FQWQAAQQPYPASSIVSEESSACSQSLARPFRAGLSPYGPETLCQGHGFAHGQGFVHRFFVLAFRRRIVDPTSAGLHVGLAVLEQCRPNRDATVQVAIEAEI